LGYNEARYPIFEKDDSAEKQACGAGPTACVQSKASCSCCIDNYHSSIDRPVIHNIKGTEGYEMKLSSLNWRLAGAVIMLLASFSVNADTRLEQVWTCTLNEGNTLEELSAIHGKWLAWANEQDYGGDIRGSVASPLVGAEFSLVLLIDSYPDLATYAADIDAYYAAVGQALDAEYDAISSCTSSALYNVTDSGSE
jgi:hypothetical protein